MNSNPIEEDEIENLNALEQARIQSEIDRNRAQTAHAEAAHVALFIDKENSWLRWGKIILGSLITAGLLAAWLIGYFAPIMSSKNELQSLENRILSSKNQEINYDLVRKQAELQDYSALLASFRDSLDKASGLLISERQQFDVNIEKLSAQLALLSTDASFTSQQRLKLKSLANEMATLLESKPLSPIPQFPEGKIALTDSLIKDLLKCNNDWTLYTYQDQKVSMEVRLAFRDNDEVIWYERGLGGSARMKWWVESQRLHISQTGPNYSSFSNSLISERLNNYEDLISINEALGQVPFTLKCRNPENILIQKPLAE